MVGKYVALVDSYKSVKEALIHGGIARAVTAHGQAIGWSLSF